jgi:hypothetical protein
MDASPTNLAGPSLIDKVRLSSVKGPPFLFIKTFVSPFHAMTEDAPAKKSYMKVGKERDGH